MLDGRMIAPGGLFSSTWAMHYGQVHL